MIGTSFVCALAAALSQPFQDDFSRYPDGSEGAPDWELTQIGFQVQKGRFVASVRGGRVYAVWRKVPPARRMVLEGTVTIKEPLGDQWKIAGIGLFQDSANYWHCALVEAPENQGRRRFFELAEMMEGVWLAHGGPHPLTTLEEWTLRSWDYGVPYAVRLVLEKDRIIGEVRDPDGQTIFRCIRLLDKKAINWGTAMLDCDGFIAAFDDLRAKVADRMAEIQRPKTISPPYRSLPLDGAPARVKGTGFFTVSQRDGIWWLIDPNGYPTVSIGTDHCNFRVHWCEKLGYAPYHTVVSAKYGTEEKWAEEAARRLLSWNFNVLGANSSVSVRYRGLPHTEFVSFGSSFADRSDIVPKVHWTGFPDVFDPAFGTFCDRLAKERCAPYRDDPWLVGYFLDNELEWWGKSGRPWGLAEEAWKKPADRPCKKALVSVLKRFYNNRISSLNRDFGTTFQVWAEVLKTQDPPRPQTERGQRALREFVAEAAGRYFRVTNEAIKRHDPNHLNLGCRFAWDAPQPAWTASGQYCDIVTVNMYPRADLENRSVPGIREHLIRRYEWCRRPIIVTEWSFPALDSVDSQGRPLPSRHGAGMRVDNQEQRAQCYALFQKTIFALPFIVGSHYFMWVDEPALGISSTFPEDSNYGLVSEADIPYPELTQMATKVNGQLARIHSGKIPDIIFRIETDRPVVENLGDASARFTLRIIEKGRATDRKVSLRPGRRLIISLPKVSVPEDQARYLHICADPEDQVAERDESNNCGDLVLPPARKPDILPHISSEQVKGIVVYNRSPVPIHDGVVSFSYRELWTSKWRPCPYVRADREWHLLPHQVDEKEGTLTVRIASLDPFSSITLWLGRQRSGQPPVGEGVAFRGTAQGAGFVVDTGVLRLIKNSDDGDAFDRILMNIDGADTELGRFQPLVWQVVGGQNLWVPPDRLEKVEVLDHGPARLVLEMIFRTDRGKEKVIPQVGPGGVLAPLQSEPQPHRCAFRFTFYPERPYFLSQLIWLENSGDQPYEVRGYYHYLLPNIGGSAADDEVGAPGVPNYWLPVVSWFDFKESVHLGLFPLEKEDRVQLGFWKDEAGRPHPDCQCPVGTVLKPQQRYPENEKGAEPVIVIFGAKEAPQSPRPWSSLYRRVRAAHQVRTFPIP